MGFFRRFASHSGRKAARLLLGAGSGADEAGPVLLTQILPFVDDRALSVVSQEFGQLPLHLHANSGSGEFLLLRKNVIHLCGDLLIVLIVARRDEFPRNGSLARVFDGHEVFDEVFFSQQLKIGGLAPGVGESLKKTGFEERRDSARRRRIGRRRRLRQRLCRDAAEEEKEEKGGGEKVENRHL